MAIEHRDRDHLTGTKPSLTACPFCGEPVGKQESWAMHWPHCSENPNAGGGE